MSERINGEIVLVQVGQVYPCPKKVNGQRYGGGAPIVSEASSASNLPASPSYYSYTGSDTRDMD